MRTRYTLACVLVAAAGLAPARAGSREAFLKMIDRPRVPLAATAEEVAAPDGLVQVNFSYTAEAGERVPGVLFRQGSDGRRPVVVALHGTGGNKEGQIPLLKQL